MEEEILRMLVEFVETASPVVWEMAKKQVAVYIAQLGFWTCFSAMGTAAFVWFARWCDKRLKADSYSDAEPGLVLGILGAITCAIITIAVASGLIGPVLNPEFYAIRALMSLVASQ